MIQDTFWTDSYVEELDPSEKLLYLYLMTNPLCNIAGIYQIRPKRVAFETGFDKDMVERLLGRFATDGKILRSGDWIVITNYAKHQSFNNPNVRKGIQRIIDNLPDSVKGLEGFETLMHFTLLNLTLPNSTLRDSEDVPTATSEASSGFNPIAAEIIKAFEVVDAKNKSYYKNKTQREACNFLIAEYGISETLARISFLPRSNLTPYFPTITTPVQLRDKWVALETAAARYKTGAKFKSTVAFG